MTALFEVTSDGKWIVTGVERTRQPPEMLNSYQVEELACAHLTFNGF